MAKIMCPECGKKLSDKVTKCPACGKAVVFCPECGSENVSPNNGVGRALVSVAFGALGASMMKKYVCDDCKNKF